MTVCETLVNSAASCAFPCSSFVLVAGSSFIGATLSHRGETKRLAVERRPRRPVSRRRQIVTAGLASARDLARRREAWRRFGPAGPDSSLRFIRAAVRGAYAT
jgi:hypothetical protein